MTENTFASFTGSDLLDDFGSRCHPGVIVSQGSGSELVVRPLSAGGQPDQALSALALPIVPVDLLCSAAGFLRHVWKVRKASAVLWMYVHPHTRRWTTHCPPQLCSETDVIADPRFKDCELPDPSTWWAGSIRTVSPELIDQPTVVEQMVPSHDGVHFLVDASVPLGRFKTYVRCGSVLHTMPIEQLIDDQLDSSWAHLSQRLVFRIPVRA